MKQFLIRNKGISLGILTVLLSALFILFPSFAEFTYRNGIFQVLRLVMDFTLQLLPFSVTVIVIPVILFFVLRYLFLGKKNIAAIVLRLVNVAGTLFFAFMLLWGFNYTCPTVASKNNLEGKQLSSESLFDFGVAVNQKAALLRKKLEPNHIIGYHFQESEIRFSLENSMKQLSIPTNGRVRCRVLSDEGLMRRMGIAGIYFPFSGEGITNNSYLPVTTMFIMAHEMSHGYGITDEGEADLAAYLALSSSSNELMQYSAELELLRNIRGKLKTMDVDKWRTLRMETDSLVEQDLQSIFRNGLAYSEYFPGMQEKLNDVYLKLMGVEGGTKSYETFVDLTWFYLEGRANDESAAANQANSAE